MALASFLTCSNLNEGISYDISRSYGQTFENKNKKPLHLSQEITRAPIKMTNYWYILPISQPVTEMDYKCLVAWSLKEEETQKSNLFMILK